VFVVRSSQQSGRLPSTEKIFLSFCFKNISTFSSGNTKQSKTDEQRKQSWQKRISEVLLFSTSKNAFLCVPMSVSREHQFHAFMANAMLPAARSKAGLPDFLYNIPKPWKIYQITTTLPNGHNIYQMLLKYSK
jgi:hypothetical protein